MTRIQRNGWSSLARLTALVLSASVLFATAAMAQGKGPRGVPTGIGDPRMGYMIDDVNVSARTITMAGETFEVNATSVLRNVKGERIRLRYLRGIQSHGVADIVKFEAQRVGGAGARQVIKSLDVVNLVP
ncbi:MAG: hypothetical protein AAGC67_11430 [Myxococcota bacterium]